MIVKISHRGGGSKSSIMLLKFHQKKEKRGGGYLIRIPDIDFCTTSVWFFEIVPCRFLTCCEKKNLPKFRQKNTKKGSKSLCGGGYRNPLGGRNLKNSWPPSRLPWSISVARNMVSVRSVSRHPPQGVAGKMCKKPPEKRVLKPRLSCSARFPAFFEPNLAQKRPPIAHIICTQIWL